MQLGKQIAATFIDYSSTFDTVSHKFLDRALARAGATNKVRAVFRDVLYSSAAAYTTAPDTDGKVDKSGIFLIRRGVLQGDITSPLYFILALDLLLYIHDNSSDKGISFLITHMVFSHIMLMRLTGSAEKILKDWQAGFLPFRGCRDNLLVL